MWFRSSVRTRASHGLDRNRSRLCFDVLEQRCLLSTVTNLNDAGPGSLRDAITATPPGETVDFQPGLTGTITLTTGELPLSKDLTIAGPGPEVLRVSSHFTSRIFNVGAFTVTISGLTLADGLTGLPGGGAIYNLGALTVIDTVFTGDRTTGNGEGGGIYNDGMLAISDSTVSGNYGDTYGGGIFNSLSGTLTITNSILSGNNGFRGGGGIYNSGTMTVIGSTLSSSSAGTFGGGGIANSGMLTVTNSTSATTPASAAEASTTTTVRSSSLTAPSAATAPPAAASAAASSTMAC